MLVIVHISFFNAKYSIEIIVGVNCITNPFDVAEIIFFAFVYSDVNTHRFIVEAHHAIGHNVSIAVSDFVIFVDKCNFIFFVFLFYKLFGTEEVSPVPIVCFLHCFINLIE